MRRARCRRDCQRCFPFLERARRHERVFKRAILVVTGLLVVGLVTGLPSGRELGVNLISAVRLALAQRLGRSAIEAERWRSREIDIRRARQAFQRSFPRYRPEVQALLRQAELAPDHALLRWGNYNRTLLLSPAVFEADERGRSYRLRPHVRSLWVRNRYTRERVLEHFLVADTPAMAQAIRAAKADAVAGSTQTTNSWGLRGPEPDPSAPVRGIVLGDSFMQGMFLGDDETPPEALRRFLQDHLQAKASLLNTGLLGYSPEQYYASLVEFADRFRPQFVVVSLYANDFGDAHDVFDGECDWDEARYWLGRIRTFCRERDLTLLVVPAPVIEQVERLRQGAFYPGHVAELAGVSGVEYLDVTDRFADAHLKAVTEAHRRGELLPSSPLFNGRLEDHHFSKLGSEVWAAAVGRRLVLLIEEKRQGLDPGDVRRMPPVIDQSG